MPLGSRILLLLALLCAVTAPAAHAAWPNSPTTNLKICGLPGDQQTPALLADGAGGAYIAWADARSGTYDIYAHHILGSGTLDPAWPTDGLLVCGASGTQYFPRLVSGAGNTLVIAWSDDRSDPSDIYAQHVLLPPAVDPAWPVNGALLCSAANEQVIMDMVSDAAGGAIVVWRDLRGNLDYDVYAQRVTAAGVVAPGWPVNGRAIAVGGGSDQEQPVMVADGVGGAVIAYLEQSSGSDVRAQRVLATGTLDPSWPASGRVLASGVFAGEPAIASDGAGGAIVAWDDNRVPGLDIYAQHVFVNGTLDAAWPVNGRDLAMNNTAQLPALTPDGAGGALVTWADSRSGNFDVYVSHVQAAGAVDPAWPAAGRAVTSLPSSQYDPRITSDGLGGAIVCWSDQRAAIGTIDIYAGHVTAAGVVDATYPVNGRGICTASGNQINSTITSDGAGGAIVAWQDLRTAAGSADIYAQRVARFGYLGTPEAEIASVKDVANDQGGQVKVSWNASYLDALSDPNLVAYDVYRSVPTSIAMARVSRGARVVPLTSGAPRAGQLVTMPAAANAYYWEFVSTTPAVHFPSGYSAVAPTEGDSVTGSNPPTAFTVVGRNSNYTIFWASRPDSGYSVDDIAPATPAPFTGTYLAGQTHLDWHPNVEADLAGYRLYRGAIAGFVPGAGNLVAALAEPGYVDAGPAGRYYKLTAIDAHGNESVPAVLAPAQTVDVPGGALPARLALLPVRPSPAHGPVTLAYALPRDAHVELGIFDAAGRRVRTLVSGAASAGQHPVVWDLNDDRGAPAGAGLFFARLEAEGQRFTARFVTLR